jgi:hypothetical protein
LSVRRLGVSGPISGKESTVGVCDGERREAEDEIAERSVEKCAWVARGNLCEHLGIEFEGSFRPEFREVGVGAGEGSSDRPCLERAREK